MHHLRSFRLCWYPLSVQCSVRNPVSNWRLFFRRILQILDPPLLKSPNSSLAYLSPPVSIQGCDLFTSAAILNPHVSQATGRFRYKWNDCLFPRYFVCSEYSTLRYISSNGLVYNEPRRAVLSANNTVTALPVTSVFGQILLLQLLAGILPKRDASRYSALSEIRRTVSPMMDTVDGCQVPTTAMGFRRWLLFEARFHRLVSSDLDAEIERCAAPRRRNTRLCGTLRSARAPQCLYYRRFCVRRARTWPNFSLRSPGAVGKRFARVKESQTRICSLLVFRVLWCTGICWCMTVNTFLVSTCVSSWTFC